jgi:hypothetical protein
MWHASPNEVCKAIGDLQSEKSAMEMMEVDATFLYEFTGQTGQGDFRKHRMVRECVRQERPKDYCDEDERADVVEYREEAESR